MNLSRRVAQLVVGLFLYGIAIALMVRAAVGVGPWEVFGLGLAKHTGLSLGLLINIVGGLVLLLWIPLRQRPGIGTVANILLLGTATDVGLALIATPEALWARILLFAGGLVLLAVASGLYIGARLGPGPRDGLMTGLNSRFGLPIWVSRTIVEVTVLAIGWLLGGNVGFGTVAFAVLIGPLAGVALPLFRVPLPVIGPPVIGPPVVEPPVVELVETPTPASTDPTR